MGELLKGSSKKHLFPKFKANIDDGLYSCKHKKMSSDQQQALSQVKEIEAREDDLLEEVTVIQETPQDDNSLQSDMDVEDFYHD